MSISDSAVVTSIDSYLLGLDCYTIPDLNLILTAIGNYVTRKSVLSSFTLIIFSIDTLTSMGITSVKSSFTYPINWQIILRFNRMIADKLFNIYACFWIATDVQSIFLNNIFFFW